MSNRYKYDKTTKQFTSWSYSRYRDYKRCPAFAKYKHLDKLPEPSSPAMARGSAIGAMAEDYVNGKLRNLPAELYAFKPHFEAARGLFKKGGVYVEESWCFDNQWRPIKHAFPLDSKGEMNWGAFKEADWTAWRSIWLRVKMDLCGVDKGVNVLRPVDHKTGKYRENDIGSYLEQLEIYSLGGMLQFPDVVGASPELWFLDADVNYPSVNREEIYYDRKELPRLQKIWMARVQPMFKDTTFRPTPNAKCTYCTYSKAKGGPCKF